MNLCAGLRWETIIINIQYFIDGSSHSFILIYRQKSSWRSPLAYKRNKNQLNLWLQSCLNWKEKKHDYSQKMCCVAFLHLYQQQIFDDSFMEIRYEIFLIDFPTLVAWEIVHSTIFNLLNPFYSFSFRCGRPSFVCGWGGIQQHSHVSNFNQLPQFRLNRKWAHPTYRNLTVTVFNPCL